jgi:NADPH:quinone reductase-like Zn-dependent oxidoreductase
VCYSAGIPRRVGAESARVRLVAWRRPTGKRLEPLVAAVAAGKVRVGIARKLPLTDAEEAHRLSQTGRMTGKLVLET